MTHVFYHIENPTLKLLKRTVKRKCEIKPVNKRKTLPHPSSTDTKSFRIPTGMPHGESKLKLGREMSSE